MVTLLGKAARTRGATLNINSRAKAMDLIKQHQDDLYEMVIGEASKVEAELVKADADADKGDEK